MFLVQAAQRFQPADLQILLLAFQETATLWEALNRQEDLAQKAFASLPENPLRWTPWDVARLLLDLPPQEDVAPPENLWREAKQAYLALHEQAQPPANARQVALLALSLHEVHRRHPTWETFPQVLEGVPWAAWREPLAVFASGLPDPQGMLLALLRHDEAAAWPLALSVVLARPAPAEQHAQALAALLPHLSPEGQVHALNTLAQHRPDLLIPLRERWEPANLPAAYRDWAEALLHTAHAPQQAHARLTQAWEHARRLQAQLAAQMAFLAERQGDAITAQTAWAQAAEADPQQPEYLARRILNLLRSGQAEQAAALLPEAAEHPALALAAARCALHRAEVDAAERHAQQALTPHLAPDLLADLAALFLGLQRPLPALEAIRLALTHTPTHAPWHDLAVRAAAQALDHFTAAHHAACAYYLDPTPARQRTLAQALENIGAWEPALSAWQSLIAATPNPTPDDLFALAHAAYRAGAPQQTLEALERLLSQQPHHRSALALYAEALAALGRHHEAIQHLRQAIAALPQASELPLALARIQEAQGETEAAFETLRLAAQAFPTEAAVQAAWGRALLRQAHYAQALTALQTAVEHDPENAEAALDLARTLLALHRTAEALALLEELNARKPYLPDLPALYGDALLRAGRPAEALQALAQALRQHPEDHTLLQRYARALLSTGQDPAAACRAAQQALALLPQDAPAAQRAAYTLTLGEAFLANGEPHQALETFRNLLQEVAENDPLALQAAKGLAKAALALDQPATALAALESLPAAQEDPEGLDLLTQACLAANLSERALAYAQQAMTRQVGDPDAALRFADLALHLKRPFEAAEALEQARLAEPHCAALYLRLADAYHAARDPQQALEALRAFLEVHHQHPFPPEDLVAAGERFLRLQAHEEAAYCISAALEATPHPQPAWYVHLVRALRLQGAHALALEKVHQALQSRPSASVAFALHIEQSHLHEALGRPEEARAALGLAARLVEAPAQHVTLAERWLALDRPLEALTAAEQALQEQNALYTARLLAAEAALALLRFQEALHWLEAFTPEQNTDPRLACLAAEVALAAGEEVAAARWLNTVAQHPPSPWLRALQARLLAAQGALAEARQRLEEALTTLPAEDRSVAAAPAWEAVACAALTLRHWEAAVETARRIAQALPGRPRAALLWAQAIVQRAEAHLLAQEAEALRRNPGPAALSPTAHHAWEQAIRQAAAALRLKPAAEVSAWARHPLLGQWILRGLALWTSEVRLPDLLGPEATPESVVAALLALRRHQGRQVRLPQELPHQTHPQVLAALALLSRRAEQALQLSRQAAEQDPADPLLHALRGRFALRTGRFGEALEAYRAALTLAPDEPRWHQRAAEAAARLGEQGLHLEHLEAAYHLEPNRLEHALALAEAYTAAGRGEQALEVLLKARELHDGHPDLALALARTAHALGRHDEALRWAQEALMQQPDRVDALLLQARVHLEQQAPQAAREVLEQLLHQHPHHPEGVRLLAEALEALGQGAEALRRLEEALAHLPEQAALALHMARAELLRRLKGPQAAAEAWQALLQARPDLPTLWQRLAATLAEAGQIEPARAAAQKALRLAESLPPEEQAQAHLLLGRLARQQGHLDQAVHHLSEALRLHPTAEGYFELGRTEYERRRYQHALRALEEAMRLAPNDPRPCYYAGLVWRDLKDYAQAEAMLKRAAHLAPEDPAIQRALAAVLAINLLHTG